VWPYRLAVRISASHAEDTGSIPVRATGGFSPLPPLPRHPAVGFLWQIVRLVLDRLVQGAEGVVEAFVLASRYRRAVKFVL
jgi:hypothetical protein